jgi:hypothetical protein
MHETTELKGFVITFEGLSELIKGNLDIKTYLPVNSEVLAVEVSGLTLKVFYDGVI